MAGFGEPLDWTRRRKEEAKDVFPTLQFSDPDQNMEVDMFAFQNLNQPPSEFSQSALGLANYAYIPEPTPDAPDVSPNVEGWTPQIQQRRSIYDEQPAFGSSFEEMNASGQQPYYFNPLSSFLERGTAAAESAFAMWKERQRKLAAGEPVNETGIFSSDNPLSIPSFFNAVGMTPSVAPQSWMDAAKKIPYVGETASSALEMAGNPATYLVPGGTEAKLVGASLLGGAAFEAGATALGGTEEQRRLASQVGMFAGPLAPTAARAAGALDRFVNPANLENAAPEAFQIGRGAGEGQVPFYGGTRPGEVPVPLQRPSVAGAADFSNAPEYQQLPEALARSAPRYRNQTLEFESDLDKALYTVGNMQTRSKSHDKFMVWLRDVTGLDDKEIYTVARERRAEIINDVKAQPGEANVVVPRKAAAGAAETAAPEGVPFMITRQMENDLRAMGVSQEEINGMTPAQAWERLRGGTTTSPSQVSDDMLRAERFARMSDEELLKINYKNGPGFGTNLDAEQSQGLRHMFLRTLPDSDLESAIRNEPDPIGLLDLKAERARRAGTLSNAPSAETSAQPPAQPPVQPPAPPTGGAAGAGKSPLESAMEKLGAGWDEEVSLRRRGVVEEEKAAGGQTRAARMAEARNAAIARGASIEEVQQEVRNAATTGRYRKTFGAAVDLSPEEEIALQNKVREVINSGGGTARAFDENRTIDALARLQSGEGIEPSQIKLLAKVLGKDLTNKLIRVNRGRISVTADLDANAKAIVDSAVKGEKAIATTEQKALAQRELADSLAQQAALDPTNKRLAAAAKKAARRADELSTRADEMLQRSAMRTIGESQDALELAAQRASVGNAISELRKAELAQRSGQQLTEQQDALLRIRDLLGRRIAVSDPRAQEIMNVLNAGMAADKAIFNRIKNDAPWFGFIKGALEGAPSNSFVAEAFNRQNQIKTALIQDGMSETLANRISRAVFDHNVNQHFNGNVPPEIAKMISDARRSGANGADLSSFAVLQQRLKNTLFGLDFQALGGILRTAIQEGNIPAAVGLVNRTLAAAHLPHVNTMIDNANISRRAQFAIDGRRYGRGAAAQDPELGTVLQYAQNLPGGFGRTIRAVDRAYSRVSDASTRAQYDTLAANLGDLIHEGNLVLDKVIGRRDITNPAVRANSAENANNLISFGRNALNGNRRAVEAFLATSPSQTRARFGRVLDAYVKLVSPTATIEDRVHAASMIASQYIVYNTLMQYLNDKIGIGELELNPAKAGYGVITTFWKDKDGNNVQLPVINNDSVQRAFARSIKVLADAKENDKTQKILEQWEKTGLGVASPVIKDVAALGAGIGYVPGAGYKFGTMTPSERIRSALPIPAVAQPLIQGEGVAATALESVGQSVYTGPGSAINVLEDKANKKYGNTKDFYDRTPRERADILAENPDLRDKYEQSKIERGGTTAAATLVLQDARKNLQGIDNALKSGRTEGGQPFTAKNWRENYHKILDSLRDKRDAIYINAETQPGKDSVLDGYFKAIDSAVDPTTKSVNWDAVDAYKSKLNEADQKYIEENTGLSVDSPTVREYKADVKRIVSSGYFDVSDNITKEFAKQLGMKGIENREQFDAELKKQLAPSLGNNPYLLDIAVGKIDGAINQATGKYKLIIFAQHPEIIPLLEKWDYGMSTTGLKLGAAMSLAPAGVR